MSFKPEKISRESIANVVFGEMKLNIINGTWKPGERLPSENEIAEAFGVSRVSVRTALNRLAALNLVVTKNGDGTYVNQFNFSTLIDEISDVMVQNVSYEEVRDFRAMLEHKSVTLATSIPHTEEELLPLRDLLEELTAALRQKDLDAFHAVDYHFHREICKLAHNNMLVYAYVMMNSVASSYWTQHTTEGKEGQKGIVITDYWKTAEDYHVRLFQAIQSGDQAEALKLLDDMI